MALKLVFIGRLEDVAGEPEREVECASTIGKVVAGLEPELAEALKGERIRVALNGDVVTGGQPIELKDGDELAFLPPVSGG